MKGKYQDRGSTLPLVRAAGVSGQPPISLPQSWEAGWGQEGAGVRTRGPPLWLLFSSAASSCSPGILDPSKSPSPQQGLWGPQAWL